MNFLELGRAAREQGKVAQYYDPFYLENVDRLNTICDDPRIASSVTLKDVIRELALANSMAGQFAFARVNYTKTPGGEYKTYFEV